MRKIHYSEFYPKLAEKEHTTIRKHKKWNLKEILQEFPEGKYLQDIEIIKIERMLLLELKPELLLKDTNRPTIEQALDLFNSLKLKVDLRYGNKPRDYDFKNEKFTIYYLKIINPRRITDFT